MNTMYQESFNKDSIEPNFSLKYGFEVKVRDFEYIARCTSNICRYERIKLVSKSTKQCPKCGYYLFWDKKEIQ